MFSLLMSCRDLKPENVLILVPNAVDLGKSIDWETIHISDIVLKISDYGMGRSIDADGASKISQTKELGTDGYTAPEVKEGNYDEKADIWSFAVTMHELATKEKPQPGGKKTPRAIHLLTNSN